MAFYAFDLLHYDEWDLRGLPLLERKQLLRSLLPSLPSLLYADHVTAGGESLAAVAAGAGFHGLIAKRAASTYRSGAQSDWRRVPLRASAEAREVEVGAALSAAVSRQRGRSDVRYSNLDKVFWPAEGYTKGDLLAFYEQVSDHLLPYLRDRPVHMNRFPDGIGGKSFFQRQAPAGIPDWVELVEVDDRHTRQFICNDLRTLLYLVNLGSIELHPWLSRRGSLAVPDYAVLDLDAKETTFANAVRVARTAGKVLRGIGLRPAIKTSGASGLHVYVALAGGFSYEQVRLFMEAVARVVARELPDIASVERLPRGRGGKVYVDFLQNRRSATVVPPYAARPVPGARVSMPLEWDELDGGLHPGRFTIANVPEMLVRRGDLFRATLTDPQDFAPAIDKLQIYLADSSP
ncbi:MAG: non-homologous end-joining DNA ligase [Spirochaetaceae bacterium]|nr:non-homologous end-joining DNA ligase [Spirochaetaceae bacterium]